MAYLDQFRTDNIVYWELPVRDYNGNDTFKAPIEDVGHFKDVRKEYILEDGNSTISNAQYLSDHPDIKEGGFLYLGNLSDLSEEEILNPKLRKDIYSIRTLNSVKIIDTGERIKLLWL